MSRLLLISIMLCLTSCAETARLYPVNKSATSTGVLTAHFKSYGTGHTEITLTMPDGEVLKGEANTLNNTSMGFGTTFASVYGSDGSAFGSGTGTSFNTAGTSPGTASAFGDKGTSLHCEYYNNNWTGHGHGACKTSKDQLYRLQY